MPASVPSAAAIGANRRRGRGVATSYGRVMMMMIVPMRVESAGPAQFAPSQIRFGSLCGTALAAPLAVPCSTTELDGTAPLITVNSVPDPGPGGGVGSAIAVAGAAVAAWAS